MRLEHLCPEAAHLLFPLAAKLPQLAQSFMLVEVDHPRRPAVGDRQVIEAVENSREALGRETLDRDAADEPIAEPRRVARPQLPAAEDRIEIGAGRRDVERDGFAGQGEVQVVDQLVAKVLAAVGVGDSEAAHPAKLHAVADCVLEIGEGFLELLEDAPSRAYTLRGIIVIDDVRHLALASQRRRVLHQEGKFALVMQLLAHELPAALLIDQARDGIAEVRELGRRIAGCGQAHRLDPGRPAAAQSGKRRVDAAGQPVALAIGAAGDVRAAVEPTGEQAAILALHDAVSDQRRPIQEIGQAGCPIAENLQSEHGRVIPCGTGASAPGSTRGT